MPPFANPTGELVVSLYESDSIKSFSLRDEIESFCPRPRFFVGERESEVAPCIRTTAQMQVFRIAQRCPETFFLASALAGVF